MRSTEIDWKELSSLNEINGKPSLGYAGPVTGIINNHLIIGGGANFPDSMPWLGGKKKYYDDAFIFVPAGDSLRFLKSIKLPDTIAYAAICNIPNGIVYAGGENQNGISKKVWQMRMDSSGNIIFDSLPDLPIALSNASLTYHNNRFYLAGGESLSSVSSAFFMLDMKTPQDGWQEMAALIKPTSHAVMISQNDKIYLIGGRMKTKSGISELYSSMYVYSITDNKWSNVKSLPYAISAGTGISIGESEIILFGGDKGETFHKTEKLISEINAEHDNAKKEALIKQKADLQSSHPGFSNEVLRYNSHKNEWNKDGSIPYSVPVTTTAFLKGDTVFIPTGEIKAGVRSSKILMGIIKYH